MGSGPMMSKNSFNFVLFLTSYQVRGWILVVGTMSISLKVGSEKGGMENIMDTPLEWKFQLECETLQDFSNDEGAYLFWSKFGLFQAEA